MTFVGYASGTKGYVFWNPAQHSFIVSRDVIFDKSVFPACREPGNHPVTPGDKMIVFLNLRFHFLLVWTVTSSHHHHSTNQTTSQNQNQNPLNSRHLHQLFYKLLVIRVHVTLQWEFLPGVHSDKGLVGMKVGRRITLRQKGLTIHLKSMLALDLMALTYLPATLTNLSLLTMMKQKWHSLTSF
ncbi:hypothetical protein GSI_15000 [Ganoderma sinense ZZ0214-1]|uniref:Retroviral polymerase SH3-like domain-containing protein n=1 Tax=Ganoderma sinense ZZ0214-1 TaxID=1077348 RepID=A0A2G8RLB8_9APHY|nr:hypothetical protein GSI_15000 [Ganoderma sinense ZZ0214-1]